MNRKAYKTFEKLVRTHGMELRQTRRGGHFAVLHDGRRVGTLSNGGETNAYKQAVRDLCRQDLLPQEARRVSF